MDRITDYEKKVIDMLRERTINDLTPKLLEDDTLFYRFAKARDFNLAEAETMLRNHIAWRKEFGIDTILTDWKPPEVLLKFGATSFIGFDKEKSAVRIQDWGHLDCKGLAHCVTKTDVAKYWFYVAEQDKALIMKTKGKIDRPDFSLIYDLMDLTYATAVNLKTVQVLMYGVKLLMDNYPEYLKIVRIINAPFYFAWGYSLVKAILPSTIIQKIRVFGKDGWKEDLLQDIDADQLPAYLGGNRTDPDGNPLCETIMHHGKLVPKSYYKKNTVKRLVLEPDAMKLTLMPFSKEEILFEVKEANSSIEWEFEVKKGDINFSLRFDEESSVILEPVELIPQQRIETTLENEKGCFKCEKIGNYSIVFDNSHSWLHSKEVYYRARINDPKSNKM